MLELQKIFLILRFFNRISCNNGLEAKILCFFSCFFCLTFRKLKCSIIRKTASFLMSHRLKKYKNLHPRSFTNGAKTWEMLKIINFFSVIWMKWKQSVCSITLPYSSTFYSLFLPFFFFFFFVVIFKFKYDKFFCQTISFHFQIRMIWTAVVFLLKHLLTVFRYNLAVICI